MQKNAKNGQSKSFNETVITKCKCTRFINFFCYQYDNKEEYSFPRAFSIKNYDFKTFKTVFSLNVYVVTVFVTETFI